MVSAYLPCLGYDTHKQHSNSKQQTTNKQHNTASGLVFATIFLSKAKGFSFSLFVSPVFHNCLHDSGQ